MNGQQSNPNGPKKRGGIGKQPKRKAHTPAQPRKSVPEIPPFGIEPLPKR
jgi:hypothetical protein